MVRPTAWVLACAVLPATVHARPADAKDKRQVYNPSLPVNRAQAVVDAFRLSWEGYYKYAFPWDELHPVTNTPGNSRSVQVECGGDDDGELGCR